MKRIIVGTAVAILVVLAGVQVAEWSRAGSPPREPTPARASLASGRAKAGPEAPAAGSDASPVTAPSSEAGYVITQAATVSPRLVAYGQVQPISLLPVNAAEPGVVTALGVLPGTHVRAGQEIAHLSGPAIQSALEQSEANVRSAQAQLSAARKTLAIEREQLPSHLSTRAAVQQARSAAAQAQTNFENAQSHLEAVRRMLALAAPANGTVLAIDAPNGQLVAAGQPVVTLQTTARLWLAASYYGPDLSLIHVGMTGVFAPADGSAPVPVRVRAVSGAMAAGEGEAIGLMPMVPTSRWINGEYGSVTLDLPPQKLVAVPTRALVLDRGKWWVLVHSPEGDRPQEVVPGPTRGWNTFLESGVSAGTQIVVEDAYLLFHRGIAKRYTPSN